MKQHRKASVASTAMPASLAPEDDDLTCTLFQELISSDSSDLDLSGPPSLPLWPRPSLPAAAGHSLRPPAQNVTLKQNRSPWRAPCTSPPRPAGRLPPLPPVASPRGLPPASPARPVSSDAMSPPDPRSKSTDKSEVKEQRPRSAEAAVAPQGGSLHDQILASSHLPVSNFCTFAVANSSDVRLSDDGPDEDSDHCRPMLLPPSGGEKVVGKRRRLRVRLAGATSERLQYKTLTEEEQLAETEEMAATIVPELTLLEPDGQHDEAPSPPYSDQSSVVLSPSSVLSSAGTRLKECSYKIHEEDLVFPAPPEVLDMGCQVCGALDLNIVEVDCGGRHLFCRQCISAWMAKQDSQRPHETPSSCGRLAVIDCPVCQRPIYRHSTPSGYVQLRLLQCRCPSCAEGGESWAGAFGDLPAHWRDECTGPRVPCKYQNAGCDTKFVCGLEDEHRVQAQSRHLRLLEQAFERNLGIAERLTEELKHNQEEMDVLRQELRGVAPATYCLASHVPLPLLVSMGGSALFDNRALITFADGVSGADTPNRWHRSFVEIFDPNGNTWISTKVVPALHPPMPRLEDDWRGFGVEMISDVEMEEAEKDCLSGESSRLVVYSTRAVLLGGAIGGVQATTRSASRHTQTSRESKASRQRRLRRRYRGGAEDFMGCCMRKGNSGHPAWEDPNPVTAVHYAFIAQISVYKEACQSPITEATARSACTMEISTVVSPLHPLLLARVNPIVLVANGLVFVFGGSRSPPHAVLESSHQDATDPHLCMEKSLQDASLPVCSFEVMPLRSQEDVSVGRAWQAYAAPQWIGHPRSGVAVNQYFAFAVRLPHTSREAMAALWGGNCRCRMFKHLMNVIRQFRPGGTTSRLVARKDRSEASEVLRKSFERNCTGVALFDHVAFFRRSPDVVPHGTWWAVQVDQTPPADALMDVSRDLAVPVSSRWRSVVEVLEVFSVDTMQSSPSTRSMGSLRALAIVLIDTGSDGHGIRSYVGILVYRNGRFVFCDLDVHDELRKCLAGVFLKLPCLPEVCRWMIDVGYSRLFGSHSNKGFIRTPASPVSCYENQQDTSFDGLALDTGHAAAPSNFLSSHVHALWI